MRTCIKGVVRPQMVEDVTLSKICISVKKKLLVPYQRSHHSQLHSSYKCTFLSMFLAQFWPHNSTTQPPVSHLSIHVVNIGCGYPAYGLPLTWDRQDRQGSYCLFLRDGLHGQSQTGWGGIGVDHGLAFGLAHLVYRAELRREHRPHGEIPHRLPA